MEDKKELHGGHRKRMMETYLRAGIDGFSDVEALEFLLCFAIPRRDTNPIAHRLLQELGSLDRVLDAPMEVLTRVEGVGPRAAALIRYLSDFWFRCEQSRLQSEKYFRTLRSIGRYLLARLGSCREERAALMCLDNKCKLLDYRELAQGTINEVNVPYRKVAETALAVNAASVVLAHNHPGGMAIPSLEDARYTRELHHALSLLNINLADHIIVSEYSYTSLKSSGFLDGL